MGNVAPTSGGSGASKVNTADAARRAEEARQRAEAARRAAEAARKAAEDARRAAEAAREKKAAAEKAAADAQKAAQKPGQTPEAAQKSKADAVIAEKNRQQATKEAAAAEKKLQEAEEKVALTAKRAQDAMVKANTLATQEKKTPPFTQKDIDSVKPKANELASAFEGTSRKSELEKLLGTAAPKKSESSRKPEKGERPPASLDAVDAKDVQAASKLADGQSFTASSGTKYQVKKNATTGETVLSDAAGGNTVTIKPDGSYTSTVTAKEATKSGGTRETTWTKSSDAQGRTTGLESRTEEVRMEKPPAALAQQPGTPKGPVTVKTETQFNSQGLPTKQVKTTQVNTPGFKTGDVSAFEASQDSALRNASKGADHHKTNNPPTSLKLGESSLTITEETRFNAKGEPAVSTRKTESVATQALKSDKNGNGVQVVRSQQEVTRGPKGAASTDSLPAISSKTPGTVTNRTTVTGYDPDGSRFDKGHASRTQTVSQSSGTVDANGQLQLKHQPTEVKSLQEASDNRWKYDHVGFEVGADGKPVPGKEPKELDKERQLPWYEDVADTVVDGLKDLADVAGDAVSDALSFTKDVVLKPVDAVIDQMTAPLEDTLADEIKKLNSAGDTLTLSGNLDVKVGLKAGIEGEAEIERTADGKYQLSAEVTGDVGVGLVGSASVSAGGRMEWKFNTPEEAARAAVILGKGPAALASGGEDHKFLLQHLSAMEVNAGVGAEAGLGAKFGPGGAELSVSVEATTSYRVEFDKGKPTHLVRTTELEGSGAASIATGLKGIAGLNLGGDVTGSVSLETKIPLDASKLDGKDVLAFLASPASAVFAGPAETSISVEGSVDKGNQGQFFTAEVSGLSGEEVQSVTKKLLDGKFENAFDDLKVDAQVTTGSFKDRELGLGAKLGVVDFEVNGRHRDVTAEGGNGNGGTTVSLGSGRRRGGSDGPSGSNGSTGNTSSTATNRPPPTEFRVNPATGQLVPVTPQEGGPSRPGRAERPGTPGSTSETRPAPTGEQGDTSPTSGRRPVPVVRNPELPGRTTHVRYDDGRVRIEAGPDATAEDIQAHMETARILQRYEGAVGKVRQLIDKVKQALTGMPGYGTQGFESRLEVQKLSNILKSLEATQAQLGTRAEGVARGGTPATETELERLRMELAQVGAQLRIHEAQVDSLAPGRGYVAREDNAPPTSGDSAPLSPEDRKKALGLLHQAKGPERWKNLLSQYGGDNEESKATRTLLHQYRATVVVEAINEAVKLQEGAEPREKCTPEALMSKEGWTSPGGVHFKASGSKNATSDLDVSIRGPDSTPVASYLMDFNQYLNEETGLDPNTLLDANILDKTEVPKGESWKAISQKLNVSERQFVQAAALMSNKYADDLRRLAEAYGLTLDSKAQELAEKAKEVLDDGIERLRTQRPELSEEELRKEAGTNIYQGFLQSVDMLAAERAELLQEFEAARNYYDPETGRHTLNDAQARELNEHNVFLHENHMWARLFLTKDYTTPSTVVDIVDNQQGGSQRELSSDQYKISAQENAWFAAESLGDAAPPDAVDASKYINRALRALQNSRPGPEVDEVLSRILDDKTKGLGRLFALRSDKNLSDLLKTREGKAAVSKETRELEKQLKNLLESLGVKPPSGKPREMMMALWVHVAKTGTPSQA